MSFCQQTDPEVHKSSQINFLNVYVAKQKWMKWERQHIENINIQEMKYLKVLERVHLLKSGLQNSLLMTIQCENEIYNFICLQE